MNRRGFVGALLALLPTMSWLRTVRNREFESQFEWQPLEGPWEFTVTRKLEKVVSPRSSTLEELNGLLAEYYGDSLDKMLDINIGGSL